MVQVVGWALSEEGVDHVAIYVDRSFVQEGVLQGRRDDVTRIFTDFANVKDVRFSVPLDTGGLPAGPHEILVRVVSRKGTTRDLAQHTVTIQH